MGCELYTLHLSPSDFLGSFILPSLPLPFQILSDLAAAGPPKHPSKIQYLNFCDWAPSYSDTLTIDQQHTDLYKRVSRCLFQTLNEKFSVINNNDERNNGEPPLELNYSLTVLVVYLSISFLIMHMLSVVLLTLLELADFIHDGCCL